VYFPAFPRDHPRAMSRSPVARSASVALAAVSLALASPRRARADAVPPPPDTCPPGQIGITSHAGPACVLKAPDDCAPGWRGVERGQCRLALCDGTDRACAAGDHCVPADLCVVESVRRWNYSDAPVHRGPELAAPPRYLSDPAHDFRAVDVCRQEAWCALGSCEALHVCLPPGMPRATTAAGAGHPVDPAYVRSVSETELQKGEGRGAPPLGGSADAPAGEGEIKGGAVHRGGCAGCGTAASPGSVGGIAAALVALAAALTRRPRV